MHSRAETFLQYIKKNWPTVLILLLALALRLFVVFAEGDRLFLGTDDKHYVQSAEILLREGRLTYEDWPHPTVFIMPGYPFFLAGIFLLAGSTNLLAARLVQALISVAAVWMAIKIGGRLGGKRTGIVAGFLLAIYPPNLTAPSFLMTEVIFTASFLAGIYQLMLAADTKKMKWAILAGLFLGIGTYFRPTSGLIPVIFMAYLWLRRDHNWFQVLRGAAVSGGVIVLLLTPWIIRNYVLFHKFVPFTISGGNPFLRGTYINTKIDVNPRKGFPWVKRSHILSDKAQKEFAKKRLAKGFRNDFWGYLRWYTVGKFWYFWKDPYYYIAMSFLAKFPVRLFHLAFLFTGAGGLVIGLWRKKKDVVLLALIMGYFTFVHMVYITGGRYSFPVMQLAIILAAYLLTRLKKEPLLQ